MPPSERSRRGRWSTGRRSGTWCRCRHRQADGADDTAPKGAFVMEPAIGVAVLALLFVATHVGLASDTVKSRLVGRLGEHGFVAAYSLIASLTFAAVVTYYAA